MKLGLIHRFRSTSAMLTALFATMLCLQVFAEEQMNPVQTALSSTTLSGYVDTSLEWDNADDFLVVFPSGTGDLSDAASIQVIPEPSAFTLFALGAGSLLLFRRCHCKAGIESKIRS